MTHSRCKLNANWRKHNTNRCKHDAIMMQTWNKHDTNQWKYDTNTMQEQCKHNAFETWLTIVMSNCTIMLNSWNKNLYTKFNTQQQKELGQGFKGYIDAINMYCNSEDCRVITKLEDHHESIDCILITCVGYFKLNYVEFEICNGPHNWWVLCLLIKLNIFQFPSIISYNLKKKPVFYI